VVTPQRNLPPSAEPWGRHVDQSLGAIVQAQKEASQETTAAFKAINSTMNQVSQQIAELAAVTATLASQQTTLAAQQAQLSAAFTELAGISANQVTGATASNYTPAAIPVAVGGVYAVASVTVPTGYTRAIVSANTSAVATGIDHIAYIATTISGNKGFDMPFVTPSPGAAFSSGACGHSVTLTGLTAGSTITAGARVGAASSVGGVYFINVMSVMFLK
jgi:hypothetical protein